MLSSNLGLTLIRIKGGRVASFSTSADSVWCFTFTSGFKSWSVNGLQLHALIGKGIIIRH